jgi:tetratricopeptide (TPR) repeat protein
LYPFKRIALSNPFERTMRVSKEGVEAFRYLAGLCLPERLTHLAEIKFELNNLYWAENWEKAEEVFRRVVILDLLETPALHALRGQFWFLSVFGKCIDYEQWTSDFVFDWIFSLPDFTESAFEREHPGEKYPEEWQCRAMEFNHLTRPELLVVGSLRHWVLMAWCTNPRAPQPQYSPVLPQICSQAMGSEDLNLLVSGEKHESTLEDLRRFVHERDRDFQSLRPPTLSTSQQSRLSMAAEDLRQAIKLDKTLGQAYRPLLARTLFCLGDFEEAARTLDEMIEGRVVLKEECTGTSEDYRWEIFFLAAWSRQLAGDTEGAIDTLERMAVDQTGRAGPKWWAAKWCSEKGEYEKAAEYLKMERENRLYSPPESWQLSTILTLGRLASEREEAATFSRKLEEKNPTLSRMMTGLIQEHWPAFAVLREDSRSRWLYAAAQAHADCLGPEFQAACFNSAIREYGWVLEHELRDRVFGEFRKAVLSDPHLRKTLERDFLKDTKDPFLRFVQQRPEIGLGAMVNEIKHCGESKRETEQSFFRWLRGRFPRINEATTAMEHVSKARNLATHENATFSLECVLEVSNQCRKALEAFLPLRSSAFS